MVTKHRAGTSQKASAGAPAARGRLEDLAPELADVVYVACGTALAYGIDLDAVLAEVHRANLGADRRRVARLVVEEGPEERGIFLPFAVDRPGRARHGIAGARSR